MTRSMGVLLLLGSGLLSGCALFKRESAAPPPPPPAVRLEVQAPDDVRPLLENHLDLGRLRSVAGDEPVSDVELQRLEAATPAQARALLETEGYFAAEVALERMPGDPPLVRVKVQPGPRARVTGVRLDVEGPLALAAKAGDRRARRSRAALPREWLLPPGTPFRNPAWSQAKTAALAQLRAEGYAAASWRETEARIDAQAHTVELKLVADSGPLYRTGALRIEGLDRQSEDTVRNLANFPAGTPATEALLLDYQERLQKSGLFAGATVTLDPDPATAAAAPVTVRLREQELQTATVGIGISANTGPRVSLDHIHRRPFGQRATARNKFEIGSLRQAWDGELSSQVLPRLWRNLVGGSYERLKSDTDLVTSVSARLGRTQETERIDRLGFVQVERSITDQGSLSERADALSLNLHGTWRDVDNILVPIRGQGLSLQTAGGYARSEVGGVAERGPFGRAYAKLQVWRPIGRMWFGQARLELGQVFVKDGLLVPESLRFRAGGDESVRGYEYRSLGPKSNGEVESANLLFTTSIELARTISPALPGVLGAVFIDAGNAANDWKDLKPAVGVGVGVRYRSPIGPFRVDLAYGERVQAFRLHLSVGVSF